MRFIEGKPSETGVKPEDYYEIFKAVRWTEESPKFTYDKVAKAYLNAYYQVAVYDGDHLIGTGRIISDGFYAFIVEVMIKPDFQRKGIGTGIMKRLIAKCIADDIPTIYLWSAEGKHPFYEKLGFKMKDPKTPFMYYSFGA